MDVARVLVIDDDPNKVQLFKIGLECEGHILADVISSFDEARQKLREPDQAGRTLQDTQLVLVDSELVSGNDTQTGDCVTSWIRSAQRLQKVSSSIVILGISNVESVIGVDRSFVNNPVGVLDYIRDLA